MDLKPLQQQTLKLRMTAELRQAITILQFSSQELSDYLREQALDNPLIELEEPAGPPPEMTFYPKGGRRNGEYVDPFLFVADDDGDFKDDLMQQARLLNVGRKEYEILSHLILSLDENGYLRDDLERVAFDLQCPVEDVEAALRTLQSFEPAGIGARDLRECLLLQARRLRPDDELVQRLITEHLEDIAEGELEALSHTLSVSRLRLDEAVRFIQTLQPKPALAMAKETPVYIRPDLVVEADGADFTVRLMDDGVPEIRMNREYEAVWSSAGGEAQRYLEKKYKQMLWLMRCVEQRRATLLNVTKTIMEKQRDFLERGPKALAPLTLRDVAMELGVHESTVSRAVKEKYVQTPHGLFELKDFFSSKVKAKDAGEMSSTSVKLMIKEMIAGEDPDHPLSDQKICDLLGSRGIELSRRAVTKYRLALNIPPSSKRKRAASG